MCQTSPPFAPSRVALPLHHSGHIIKHDDKTAIDTACQMGAAHQHNLLAIGVYYFHLFVQFTTLPLTILQFISLVTVKLLQHRANKPFQGWMLLTKLFKRLIDEVFQRNTQNMSSSKIKGA